MRSLLKSSEIPPSNSKTNNSQGQVVVANVPHGEGPGEESDVIEGNPSFLLELQQFLKQNNKGQQSGNMYSNSKRFCDEYYTQDTKTLQRDSLVQSDLVFHQAATPHPHPAHLQYGPGNNPVSVSLTHAVLGWTWPSVSLSHLQYGAGCDPVLVSLTHSMGLDVTQCWSLSPAVQGWM